MYIWERTEWPALVWQDAIVAAPLAAVRHDHGRLIGRMEVLGLKLREEAVLQTLTQDVVKESMQVRKISCQDAGEAALAPLRHVEGICAAYGVVPGSAALQFSMRDPRVASTVVCVSGPERVTQTFHWAAAPIAAQVWDALGHMAFETEDPEASRVFRPG